MTRTTRMRDEEAMDAKLAAAVMRTHFPAVRPEGVRWLGEGYDSTAFEADDEWVFRFPKRSDVEQQLLLELRLLPVLAGESPLPVPDFSLAGAPSRLFPRHFGGYRKLCGEPAIRIDPRIVPFDRLAPVLAAFLSWLHGFSPDRAARLGVPRLHAASPLEDARADAMAELERVRRVAPELVAHAWIQYLGEPPSVGGESPASECLVHGDLAAEHILYDAATRSISGVIDWSDVAIGDPSVDLAGVFHWGGERFLDGVLTTYRGPADQTTPARARYLAACRGIADVAFGIEKGRAEYVAAGVRALDFSTTPGDGV